MPEIRVSVELRGVNKTVSVDALVDTGAPSNYLRPVLKGGTAVDAVGPSAVYRRRSVSLPNSQPVAVDPINFPSMRLYKRTFESPTFLLMDGMREEAIIGYRTMVDLDLVLRPRIDRAWPHQSL